MHGKAMVWVVMECMEAVLVKELAEARKVLAKQVEAGEVSL